MIKIESEDDRFEIRVSFLAVHSASKIGADLNCWARSSNKIDAKKDCIEALDRIIKKIEEYKEKVADI